jgi:hypothetical protein
MGMKVVEPQFVQQRFFDNFVREQKRFEPDRLHQPPNGSRKVPINKNGFAIDTITGDVRNIIIVADPPHPASKGFDHVKKHRIVDVFGFVAQLFLQVHCQPFVSAGPQPRSGYSSEP